MITPHEDAHWFGTAVAIDGNITIAGTLRVAYFVNVTTGQEIHNLQVPRARSNLTAIARFRDISIRM